MSYQPIWDGRSNYGGKRRHLFLRVLLILLGLGMILYGALEIYVAVHDGDRVEGQPQVMVILGCQVKPWGPSVTLQDRLDKALDYLEEHPDMTVVASGGQGADEHISEAQCIYDYLTANGVKGENILLEENSHNTWQNVSHSAALLRERGYDPAQPVLLVTNGKHLARAKMLWRRAVDNATEVGGLAAPVSHFPTAVTMTLREPLALVKSFVFDR